MANRNKRLILQNGIHYTPQPVADLLATEAVERADVSVLDPACGDGALLAAVAKRCYALNGAEKPNLFGCDKLLPGKRAANLPVCKLVKEDFFRFESSMKFDLVVTNPPYVAATLMPESERTALHKTFGGLCALSAEADLWAYFLLHSLSYLKNGGTLAAVLPWSFVQSKYAASLRRWLRPQFASIRTLALTRACFNQTNKRVILLWLSGYKREPAEIYVAFSKDATGPHNYFSVSESEWDGETVHCSKEHKTDAILEVYHQSHGFSHFSDHANVLIGIVTGANHYFILSKEKAKQNGFHHKTLLPIITSSREISDLVMEGAAPPGRLLKLSSDPPRRYNRFLGQGEEQGIHLTSHSSRRMPWYVVNDGKIPDAFFPYRVSSTPFLAINRGGFQCTNAVHRIYFSGTRACEREWIQVSLLSVPGQLSLEAYGRTYGNGVLKVEPGALKMASVYRGIGSVPREIYGKIRKQLVERNKTAAMKTATKLLDELLGIPKALSKEASFALEELRQRRMKWNEPAAKV